MKSSAIQQPTLALLAGATFFAGDADAGVIVNQDFDANNVGFDNFGTYNHSQAYYAGNDIYGASASENYGWRPGTSNIYSATTVDLTTLHTVAEIDGGAVQVSASCWLAGYSDGDHGALRVSFFASSDGSGIATGSFLFNPGAGGAPAYWVGSADASGQPDPAIPNTTDNWSKFENIAGVPPGTRSVKVEWLGYRNGVPGTGGSNGNDAYLDDCLVETSIVPVPSWTGAVSSEWSTAVLAEPKNWADSLDPGTHLDFADGDPVLFTDSASTFTVDISNGDVSPSSVSFLSGSYEITGSNGIAGSTGISHSGTGTLTISNPNTLAGPVDVADGTLVINHPLAIQNAVPTAYFGYGTCQFGSVTEATVGGLGGDADLELANSSSQPVALTVGNGNVSAAFSGMLGGNGSLAKAGTGSQALNYESSFTGGTTIMQGPAHATGPGTAAAIHLGSQNALGTGPVVFTNSSSTSLLRFTTDLELTNDVTLSNAAGIVSEINVDSVLTVEISGKVSGGEATSSLFLDSSVAGASSTLVLSNDLNDFVVSKIMMWRGTLAITSDGALGHPTNDIEHYTESLNGQLRFDADNIVLNPERSIILTGAANNRPFNTQDFTTTIEGEISGGGNIVKTGTGTLILTSTANSQTGAVEVTEGTLQVDGNLATGTSAVTVAAGAVLSGNGSIARPVTANGSISPGASVGSLEVGSVTLPGTFTVEVDGATSDQLVVTGDLDLTGGTLAVSATGAGFTEPSYVIATYTGTLTGTFASVTPGFTVTYNAGQITLQQGDAFDSWAAAKGVSGFDIDSDNDGITNGIEFVIGGEPASGAGSDSSSLLPTASLDSGTNELVFVFRRSAASAYLDPTAEYSVGLSGWMVAVDGQDGVTVATTTNGFGQGIDRVEARIPQALSPGGRLFCRLAVSK